MSACARGRRRSLKEDQALRQLGLEFLGVFGLSPVELVHIAADLDCQFIGTVPAPIDYNPENYPKWNLMEDAGLRRDLKAALKDRGVELLLGDGNAFLPGTDARETIAPQLDLYKELGIRKVNSISFEPDLQRTYDQFGIFVEMAVERGLEPSIEACPISVVGDLATAIGAVRHAGAPAKILLDVMHFFRSGTPLQDLADASDMIGHIQLCDAPRQPVIADYLEEAMFERRLPGDGDAPVAEILATLANVPTIGLEIPLRSLAEQGLGPRGRMERCVASARKVIAEADAA
ncbi:sugar phosphate isomerase/epimerase family protein [Sphingopyxis flava]|uniref:Sugar phosphate isomerase/epimerase n=1 Tax=Sphingopyxis flava TaxID=1507287 RepID=A0A1T5E6N3_9SPHN|nr:TIM barrel protein [Sphingopyxis flava]SKB79506.1 Sugar phosphate isomerase/epimerase [Sphingopyxis flava]